MSYELKIPKEFLCEAGLACEHFRIEELCKSVGSFNGSKPKSDEEIEELEEKLKEITTLVKKLENKVVPAVLGNRALSCRRPNNISWGRYVYRKGLEKLEEAKREKTRREAIAKLGGASKAKKKKQQKKT